MFAKIIKKKLRWITVVLFGTSLRLSTRAIRIIAVFDSLFFDYFYFLYIIFNCLVFITSGWASWLLAVLLLLLAVAHGVARLYRNIDKPPAHLPFGNQSKTRSVDLFSVFFNKFHIVSPQKVNSLVNKDIYNFLV